MTSNRRISPFWALFLGILAASSASIFITKAQGDVGSLTIAAWRLSLATLVLIPFTLLTRHAEFKKITRRNWFLFILSGIFLALHFACWITSLRYTSLASSVILVATSPLWVALLAPLFLHEKITKWIAIGLVVALFGSVIVGLSMGCDWSMGSLNCQNLFDTFFGKPLLGNILALLGAIFSASYLMVGRAVRREVSVEVYVLIVYGVAAIILIGLAIGFNENIIGFPPVNYIWLAALALIPQIIGHSTFNWALKYIPAALVSLALLGEPIGSILLAYIFLHKTPTILEVVGGALILMGVYLATQTMKQEEATD